MQARNILTNLSPARLTTLHHVKSFILRVLVAYRHQNIFEIKSKCITVNWQKYQVSPQTRKECPTKVGVMHL